MCKEDVRLSRAAVPGDSVTVVPTAVMTQILKANPERYGLQAGINGVLTTAATGSCTVYAKNGNNLYPLIGLAQDHPAGVININNVGLIITYDIWAIVNDSTVPVNLTVSESKWNVQQDDI